VRFDKQFIWSTIHRRLYDPPSRVTIPPKMLDMFQSTIQRTSKYYSTRETEPSVAQTNKALEPVPQLPGLHPGSKVRSRPTQCWTLTK